MHSDQLLLLLVVFFSIACFFRAATFAQFICAPPPPQQLIIQFSANPSFYPSFAPPAFLAPTPAMVAPPAAFPPPPIPPFVVPPAAFPPPLLREPIGVPPPFLPPPPPPILAPPPPPPPLPPPPAVFPPMAFPPPPLPPPPAVFPPMAFPPPPPLPLLGNNVFYSPMPMPGYTCTIIGALKRRRRNGHRHSNPYFEQFRDEYGGFTVSYVFDDKRHKLEGMDSRLSSAAGDEHQQEKHGHGAVSEVKEYNANWADEYGVGQDRLPKNMAKLGQGKKSKQSNEEEKEKLVVITVPDKFSPWTLERRMNQHTVHDNQARE